jgi:hypothetical protein
MKKVQYMIQKMKKLVLAVTFEYLIKHVFSQIMKGKLLFLELLILKITKYLKLNKLNNTFNIYFLLMYKKKLQKKKNQK